MLARPVGTVRPVPHQMAGHGRNDQFVAMTDEILHQDATGVFLGGTGRRAVVVGEIEVGDPAVEGAVHDPPSLLEIVNPAEVMPEPEGYGRQEQTGIAAAVIW